MSEKPFHHPQALGIETGACMGFLVKGHFHCGYREAGRMGEEVKNLLSIDSAAKDVCTVSHSC